MKKNRQEAIIELIQKYPIETQEELLSRLHEMGFQTTQATISRDIRELELTKVPISDGKQAYSLLADRIRIIESTDGFFQKRSFPWNLQKICW